MSVNLSLHSYLDYTNLLSALLRPLQKYQEANSSYLILPNENNVNYTMHEEHVESFSRMLLGLSLLELDDDLLHIIIGKILKGIDVSSKFYWGNIKGNSQLLVELFPIIFFLFRHKESISIFDKEKIERYFGQVNNVDVDRNNWQFFPILVNLMLCNLGLHYSKDKISEYWREIDNLYLGNGWFRDGMIVEQEDYYNAFAFHFYSLLYAYFLPEDKERYNLIIERANAFAQTFIYFFSDSGEFVPYGRSLTYKFAPLAFWAMLTHFTNDERRLSIIKGIINRNLRWWMSHNIFTSDKLLSNGYTYCNPFMLEQYNGVGSPYWALKAFFFLLNPKSKFFDVNENALPKLNSFIYIPEAHLSVFRSHGNAFLFMNGQSNSWFCANIAKYQKFCYSSLFGFCVPRSDANYSTLAPDSTLVAHVGESTMVRSQAKVILNNEKVQISDWNPLPGLLIRSFVFPSLPWHIRVHYVVSDYYTELRDYAFAVEENSTKAFSEIISSTANVQIAFETCAPNTNILHPHTQLPYARVEFPAGTHLFVTAIYGDNVKADSKPDLQHYFISHGKLNASGALYPLPDIPFRQSVRKLLNILK